MSGAVESADKSPGFLASLGENVLSTATTAGGMTILGFKVLHRLITFKFDGLELLRNLERMGVRSIPIVIVTALTLIPRPKERLAEETALAHAAAGGH